MTKILEKLYMIRDTNASKWQKQH